MKSTVHEATHPYDAICVLGYQFNDAFRLPGHVFPRLEYASRLYHGHIAPVIIVSGKWSRSLEERGILVPTTEAREMKEYLMSIGVPHDVIWEERWSKDTIENAYYIKTRFATPRALNKLFIVCADYHVERVRHIFYKIFGKTFSVTIEGTPTEHGQDVQFIQSQSMIFERQKSTLEAMAPGGDTTIRHLMDPP